MTSNKRLITRRRSPQDRRRYILALTATGQRVLKDANRRITAAERELLTPLDAQEAETLRELATARSPPTGRPMPRTRKRLVMRAVEQAPTPHDPPSHQPVPSSDMSATLSRVAETTVDRAHANMITQTRSYIASISAAYLAEMTRRLSFIVAVSSSPPGCHVTGTTV